MDYKKEIIRELSNITSSGLRPHDIFSDWLSLVNATMKTLPGHLKAARTGSTYLENQETLKVFEDVKNRLRQPEHYFHHYQNAFGYLIESTSEYRDVLGDVFMEFLNPNPRTGQYFTPWNIAVAMGEMTMDAIEQKLYERIKVAATGNPLAEAMILGSSLFTEPKEIEDHFINRLLPIVAQDVKPIKVSDPACGSGIMLLGCAAHVPAWALKYNLVRFYGQDVDRRCVLMAETNMMLYGLNGFVIRCALDVSDEELAAMQENNRKAVEEARQFESVGDTEAVEQIAVELRTGQYVQAKLFESVNL